MSEQPKARGGNALRQRRARRLAERRLEIEQQIADGSLTVRQATSAEREKYGIRDDAPDRLAGDRDDH